MSPPLSVAKECSDPDPAASLCARNVQLSKQRKLKNFKVKLPAVKKDSEISEESCTAQEKPKMELLGQLFQKLQSDIDRSRKRVKIPSLKKRWTQEFKRILTKIAY